ncbi:MAG: MBL fold metallo-hydrolase, partial [Parasporobacterium sp.]|nr:MBL fold metallo-hydrolase [Parasporobacterium sp.]
EDISALAQINIAAVEKLLDRISFFCSEPKSFEELLHDLFTDYGMTMSIQQYALIGSTVRSCLSGLLTKGQIKYICEDGYVKWQKL